MLDLLRYWPPRPPASPRRSLTLVSNNIRRTHNNAVLRAALTLAAKDGHIIRSWSWTDPNTATAACLECALTLTVDTTLQRGYEATGAMLETYCR